MSNDYAPRSEQRQHLNISNHAHEILLSDINTFAERGGMSGIINRILANYMDNSEASISSSIERRRQALTDTILVEKMASGMFDDTSHVQLSPSERKTVDLLASAYGQELVDRFVNNPAPKQKTLKIRLQNDMYAIVGAKARLADECYITSGNYIKAVIEDYASLSLYRREAVYFRDMYELIKSKLRIPVPDRQLMTIRIKNSNGVMKDYRVKLYDMSSDADSPYHYLVTLSHPASSTKADYAPAVFRLSRIIKLFDTPSYGSGKITAKESKAVKDAIETKSLPYILDEIEEFHIGLTPDGVKKFKSILHLRPKPEEIKTGTQKSRPMILYFKCTYRQIENYFFKFGKDATILSPKKRAEDFKKAYKEAFEAY